MPPRNRAKSSTPILLSQLSWFIRLRWIAASAVAFVGLLDLRWPNLVGRPASLLAMGAVIFAYNCAIRWTVRRSEPADRWRLHVLAWAQICLDLGCLTLLTIWTGDLTSPVVGFYVFHMIFGSLLLPRRTAYAGATIGIAMLAMALWFSGRWPAPGSLQQVMFVGWMVTVLLTVHLANHITQALRQGRRRLMRQNRQIRRITRRMQQQQNTIVAQEKMAALGQMAAGITHEIANPLASMDSLLQLVQRRPERADAKTIETLRAQVVRINQIVRQMATFAHPGDGQWETCAINDVVEAALEMVRFDKRLKGVQVERQFEAAAGQARLIPQATQQVLVNLITNALDAMEEAADRRLILRTGRSEQWCVVHVTDTGHGIRPEHIQRVFEPFFTTKPLGKGTGVGLSISYSLMKRQNGDIQVLSRPGEGTTFTIRLAAAGE